MTSKKMSAHRKRFAQAFRGCKAEGKKPFTKSFGACMKKKLKKKR